MKDTTLWTYRPEVGIDGNDLVGYDVEASDGKIGKIDESTFDADRQHLVVDTGFWIFGKRRLIPAGAVTHVDHGASCVFVSLTKEQIKNAPDFDDLETGMTDPAERFRRHDDFYSGVNW